MIPVTARIADERAYAADIEEMQELHPEHADSLGEDLINQIAVINRLTGMSNQTFDTDGPGHAFLMENHDLQCFERAKKRAGRGGPAPTGVAFSEACVAWLNDQVGQPNYKLWDRNDLVGIAFRREDDAFAFRMRWS